MIRTEGTMAQMCSDIYDDGFFARRNAARARLDAINPHLKPGGEPSDPLRDHWYGTIYDLAGDDPAAIPWARLAPHPLLTQWLARNGSLAGRRAIDVGCGLGDNAEALSAAGADVTAFDFIPRAIEWAKQRFLESRVQFQVANLLEAPEKWRGTFDLVHECYTLQTMGDELLPLAAKALASFVTPGGVLLVITSAREEDDPIVTPWRPLTREQIEGFAIDGLTLETLEDIAPEDYTPRHWRAVFRR